VDEFKARLLGELIFSLICVISKVSHIGDILDIQDGVPAMTEKPEDDVERDVALGMTKV
jgi:hypothetical protein